LERIFNLDPQLIQDAIILAINIFILFTVASYLFFNPVRDVLKKRQEKIRLEKEKAEKEVEDAQALKAEYEIKLKEIEKEAELILSEARKKAISRDKAMLEEAQAEAARIIERAETEVALEKRKAVNDMKKEMIQIASVMAGKVVSASIDAKVQDALIDETLKEIGDSTWLS
jgi:F-type H+-transporting ATPase subunit b